MTTASGPKIAAPFAHWSSGLHQQTALSLLCLEWRGLSVPGVPHHITQRGVRRFNVFLDDADHRRYLELLAHYAPQFGLAITAYCLITNHVHIVGDA